AQAQIIAEFDYSSSPGSTFQQPFYENYRIQQTFTPTATGDLDSVDLTISSHVANNPDMVPLSVAIYAVADSGLNGLQPTGAALATGMIAADDPQFDTPFIEWINVDMTPYELQQGTTYALLADALPTIEA